MSDVTPSPVQAAWFESLTDVQRSHFRELLIAVDAAILHVEMFNYECGHRGQYYGVNSDDVAVFLAEVEGVGASRFMTRLAVRMYWDEISRLADESERAA